MAGLLNLDKKKKEKETFLDLIKWPSKNGLLLLSLLCSLQVCWFSSLGIQVPRQGWRAWAFIEQSDVFKIVKLESPKQIRDLMEHMNMPCHRGELNMLYSVGDQETHASCSQFFFG